MAPAHGDDEVEPSSPLTEGSCDADGGGGGGSTGGADDELGSSTSPKADKILRSNPNFRSLTITDPGRREEVAAILHEAALGGSEGLDVEEGHGEGALLPGFEAFSFSCADEVTTLWGASTRKTKTRCAAPIPCPVPERAHAHTHEFRASALVVNIACRLAHR
jgi:hypothetical protein